MERQPPDELRMRDLTAIARRRWWIILLVPLVAAAVLAWRIDAQSYQATVRASVLIPGDTEIPGNSERPELMVLDDLPSLIDSRAFAESVLSAIPVTEASVEEVQRALDGTRYSRILTITVTHDDATEATRIAEAAASVLPGAVNLYLVADGEAPATVRIIDPSGEPTRTRPYQWLKAAIQVAVAVGLGLALAAVAETLDPRLRGADQIERALGVPVLADLRGTRGRAARTRSRA
jgi:capsular polysaccharide biosynthesis protein